MKRKGLSWTTEHYEAYRAKRSAGVMQGGAPEELKSESQEQAAVIEWADNHPEIAGRLFAIPNGAHKSKAGAAKFKREGLRRGVPDLFLPLARKGFHGLFIEMKREKKAVISHQQRDWLDYLASQGYYTALCFGAHEAIHEINGYLAP
jgi:hypothetical protein